MPNRKLFTLVCVFLFTLYLFLLLFKPFKLRAFDIEKNHDPYIFKTWTTEDGLPQNSVLSLIQDKTGYIWLGTRSGLVRFDGVVFRVFNQWNTRPLKNNNILALYEDRNGVLWIGTDGGGLNGLKNGKWFSFTTKDGLSNNNIRTIFEDREGNLWIGTANGLNHLKNGKCTVYTAEDDLWGNSITAITANSSGGLWIGTDDNGLYWVKDGKYRAVELKDPIARVEITSLCEDGSGGLWIGTENGLYCLKNGKIQTSTPKDHPLSDQSIRTLMKDSRGDLWIGTDGEGTYRFTNNRFTMISTPYGLTLNDDFIYAILEDREANLWIGTYTSGLVRLTHARVTTITTENGLPQNLVRTLLVDNSGHLWVGTDRKGVVKLTTEGAETIEKLSDSRVNALYQDIEHNLWIGTQKGGLTCIKNETSHVYTTRHGLSSDEITVIFGDSSGTLWIGTSNGLNQFEKGRFTIYNDKETGPSGSGIHIRTITEDRQHRLWIGTQQGLKLLIDNYLQDFSTAKGEKCKHDVLSLAADDKNNLWIGTNGSGLVCLNKETLTLYTYTTESGLPSNDIFSILEDHQGNLWMSSYRGLFRVSKRQLEAVAQKRIPKLTPLCIDEKDGMRSSECVMGGQPSAWKTTNGKLYFPTLKGVAVLNPSSININRKPPEIIIEEVFVDNKPVKMGEDTVFVFSSEKKIFEFYFTALSFTAPEKVHIRYKLEGFDNQWKDVSPQQKRAALYLNLDPGNYRFKAIACNNDGLWNDKGAAFEFKIKFPFYKQPLFYLLIILILPAVVGALWLSYRKRKIKASKDERDGKKYKTSALLPETVEVVLPRLMQLMEEKKVFLDADLTLYKLARQLNVHYNHLSQIINEKLKRSFNDFINSYRIEEAKKKLENPAENKKTILEIAYETGFYSKSVFNTAFKKFTGMTPSEFRKASIS
jgi:ligand-binding sensor domain-containing protein/AraC-like DNA-binding protein